MTGALTTFGHAFNQINLQGQVYFY